MEAVALGLPGPFPPVCEELKDGRPITRMRRHG
jgi:hypothetical protein